MRGNKTLSDQSEMAKGRGPAKFNKSNTTQQAYRRREGQPLCERTYKSIHKNPTEYLKATAVGAEVRGGRG